MGCTRPSLMRGGDLQDLRVAGDSDGLLRALVERELAFAGVSLHTGSGLSAEVEVLPIRAKMIGFRKRGNRHSSLQACEARVARVALVVMRDAEGRKIAASGEIQAERNFDFEPSQLTQEELDFSAGQLTIYDEARHFAARQAEGELAARVADWVVLQLNFAKK